MQPAATKKSKSGKPSGTSGSSKTGATATGSSQPGKSSGNKNSKESFQKKLLICQKTFDYKDESRDVKGKTERLNAINEI